METSTSIIPIYSKPNILESECTKQKIDKCKYENASFLDLCDLQLSDFPESIIELSNIQKLYLSNNQIKQIPSKAFEHLVQLKWLDLRNNRLTFLPAEIKNLSCLENLLVDNNKLEYLPVELGLLQQLKGLHFRNNPIRFPPQSILKQGSRCVINFLLGCYWRLVELSTQKTADFCKSKTIETNDNCGINDASVQAINCDTKRLDKKCLDELEDLSSYFSKSMQCGDNLGKYSNLELRRTKSDELVTETSHLNDERNDYTNVGTENETNLIERLQILGVLEDMCNIDNALVTKEGQKMLSRHWAPNKSKVYKKIEHQYLQYKRRSLEHLNTSLLARLPNQSSRHSTLLPENPPQPTLARIESNYRREKRKKERQQKMIHEYYLIQKLQDKKFREDWKNEYIRNQQEKLYEYLRKTHKEIKDEANERIVAAPYDVQKNELKMLGSSELNAIRCRPIKKIRPSCLDPHTILQLELASLERDKRLTKQVSQHTKNILEQFQLPLPTHHHEIRSELLAAKQNLDRAIRLHRRVQQRLETMSHFHGSNRRDQW